MNQVINTEKAPKAIGPYSQAIKTGNGFLFISGQLPMNRATGIMAEGIVAQTEQVLENIKAILNEAGYDFKDVVKSNCLLDSMDDFSAMNEVYGKYYTEILPARAAFAVVKLPMGVLIEIETIAYKAE